MWKTCSSWLERIGSNVPRNWVFLQKRPNRWWDAKKIPLSSILFLDIETVPETEKFQELSEPKQELWGKKSAYQRREEFTAEEFYPRAGIWAESGK